MLMLTHSDKEQELAELTVKSMNYLASKPYTQAMRIVDEVDPLSDEVITMLRK